MITIAMKKGGKVGCFHFYITYKYDSLKPRSRYIKSSRFNVILKFLVKYFSGSTAPIYGVFD